ncbi:MAG TPA: DUF2905 domain-containing protein [Candidatus Nanoarchaeia archaeon]|nr:DUF2905 domain-containing protein [Candidatus Nanoarchaeia archaeon]
MISVSTLLIILGGVLVALGVLWMFVGQFLPLGRIPGDIAVERENVKFYFPFATSIIISVVLSLLLWIFAVFRR